MSTTAVSLSGRNRSNKASLAAEVMRGLQSSLEEPQDARRGAGTIAAGVVLERIGGEEVPRARNDDPAHIDSGLVEGGPEGLRLRRIDNIVVGAVDQQEAGAIALDGGVADRR